jgi:DNA-binding MarR family transcriptional regulator
MTGIESCNCTTLRAAARRVSQFYDAKLAPSGLRVTQYAILALLREGDLTVNELAHRLDLDRTTTGKNMRPLERDRLVAVTASPEDRRRRTIALTPRGAAALRDAAPLWRAAQREFERLNGSTVADTLRSMLTSVRVEPTTRTSTRVEDGAGAARSRAADRSAT